MYMYKPLRQSNKSFRKTHITSHYNSPTDQEIENPCLLQSQLPARILGYLSYEGGCHYFKVSEKVMSILYKPAWSELSLFACAHV